MREAEVDMAEFFYHQPTSFLIISALSPLGNEAKKIFLQSEKWYIFSFSFSAILMTYIPEQK